MTIKELLERQYAQQESFLGQLPEESAQKQEMAKKMAYHLILETFEYLDEINGERKLRVEELVDVLKYLMSLLWVEGISPAELEQVFAQKTDRVYKSHQRKMWAKKYCDLGTSSFHFPNE